MPCASELPRMNKHFKIVAMLHVVFGAVTLVGLALIAHVEQTIMNMSRVLGADRPMPHNSGVVVDFFLSALPLLFVVQIAGGWGLWKGKAWARPVLITMGILCLLAFPSGTALGIYTMWVLLAQMPCPAIDSPSLR